MQNSNHIDHKSLSSKILLLALSLLLVAVLLLPSNKARAQSSAPSFQTLNISLWPEFDRPDVLVIYRGELSTSTELPTQIAFRLPSYVENMHAVAAKQDNTLLNVDPASIEWTREEDKALLSFPTSLSEIHLEYYDPIILTKQGQTRQITYTLFVPYDTSTTLLEIQHPIQSEGFSIIPTPIDTRIGNDGLEYSTVQVDNLAAGDTFELSITYQRNTNELSVSSFSNETQEQPVNVPAPTTSNEKNPWTYAIYAAVGAGVVFLLFLWREANLRSKMQAEYQKRPPSAAPPKRTRRGKRRSGKIESGRGTSAHPPHTSGADEPVAMFCYQCGSALQENANFCHTCGAPRRGT
ncbi:MAG: zinc ribbon domain-containing protein [Chloroflexi bacterium]|nr:zinc ribbon domain-containing protein [Chloroflexota bacterium]